VLRFVFARGWRRIRPALLVYLALVIPIACVTRLALFRDLTSKMVAGVLGFAIIAPAFVAGVVVTRTRAASCVDDASVRARGRIAPQ
jgi:hypothetical protein